MLTPLFRYPIRLYACLALVLLSVTSLPVLEAQIAPHTNALYVSTDSGLLKPYKSADYPDSKDSTKKDSFSLRKLLPNGFWLGFNYNFNNYGYSRTGPKQTFDDRSFELGLGRYYHEKNDVLFPDNWLLGGAGIGIEYRLPLTDKKTIDTLTGGNYKQFYLNIRAEIGFGFDFLSKSMALHLQAGYTSNFSHHYLRPGIGISLGRIQIGYNGLLNLDRENPKVGRDGFYFRYIYTVNTWINGTYRKPIDWDGRK